LHLNAGCNPAFCLEEAMPRRVSFIFILLVLGVGLACIVTTFPAPSLPPTSTAVTTSSALPAVDTATPALSPLPNDSGQGSLTITGTVMDVSYSAQVIFLQQPVQDISIIALTTQTKITLASGGETTLRAITPGTELQASGGVKSAGTLLATQIILLNQ